MKKYNHRGFGLIEVLVALGIMAVGLIAIASFQSSLIIESGSSKTRAEAIAIAQQRIEELRNYTGEAFDESSFNTHFTDVSDGNKTEFTGTNAVFTRSETILQPADTKEIKIVVTWVDEKGDSQNVSLSTELSWESPTLSAELDDSTDTGPFVRSATGRAELGDGEVLGTDTVNEELGGVLGLIDRGDGNLRLSKDDDVVLTLKDACLLDEKGDRTLVECTDFVKISGRVFIDQTTKATNPTDVYVIASDAAFCQRYYFTERETYNDEGVLIGSAILPTDIKDIDVSNLATATGDYLYYHYTCYLGGGWHGNIGLLVTAKNNSQDNVRACVGDPTSVDAFADPEVSIRRVYRGMAFKYTDDSKTAKETDGNGDTIYYTVGVADALQLPDPDDAEQAPHDFVISTIADSNGAECISEGIMTRDDATIGGVLGAEFVGNPTDFYCLNQNSDYVDSIKLLALGFYTDEACPFDPSDPPNERHELSGNIFLNTLEEYASTDYNLTVNTSDGPLNCSVLSTIKVDTKGYNVAYTCDVYQWTNPWSGYVQLNLGFDIFKCDSYKKYLTGIGGDSSVDEFTCSDDSGVEPEEPVITTLNVYGANAGLTNKLGTITLDVTNETTITCSDSGNAYACQLDIEAKTWSGTLNVSSSNSKNAMCITPPSGLTVDQYEIIDGIQHASITLKSINTTDVKVDIDVKPNNVSCP